MGISKIKVKIDINQKGSRVRLFLQGAKTDMTAKELKRLRRSDLMEMLLELSKENKQLYERLEEAEQKLQDRQIIIDQSGSLAEAALRLNRIFEDAQAACDQYEQNVQLRCAQLEEETRRKCYEMMGNAQE